MASRLLRPTNFALANAIKKVRKKQLEIFCSNFRFYRIYVLHKRVNIAHTT